jgi:repressor LexA
MIGITKRQREVLDFIEAFLGEQNYSPSFAEIQKHFSFKSLASVHKHVHALKKKGFITSEEHASRSIALTQETSTPQQPIAATMLPLMGQFSPGETIETFSQTSTLAVPSQLVHLPDSTYILRLKGDQLKHENLQNGDLLLVEAGSEAERGALVMLSDNEGHILLTRFQEDNGLALQGVVVGLLRVY